ncbi:MAG: branched-chain amino acid transaminase [Candidatus Eisenbacteria bacterium]
MTTKNRYAHFRGKIVPIEEARVSIMTSALNYGTGIFEGIRAYWSAEEEELFLFRLREHHERLLRNARFLFMDLPHSADGLCEATIDLLRKEEFRTDVYVRPLAYKSSEVIGVRLHDLSCDFAMFAIPFGAYIDKPDGARLMVSSWRRIADDAFPARMKITGAYVNSALAKTEASMNGFDDALMLCADGHVSEASAANFFVLRDGTLATPPVTDDILEGITRDTFIRMARDLEIPVVERPIDRSEAYGAEEAFVCGTAVGLVPVIEIDRRPIGGGKAGSVSKKLRDLYLETVTGKNPRYREWCTPVYAGK